MYKKIALSAAVVSALAFMSGCSPLWLTTAMQQPLPLRLQTQG